jgi:hypothetical protein
MITGRPRKRRALDPSVLSDGDLNEFIMCNWHRFNDALKLKPELVDLERMLKLEKARENPRANFLGRLQGLIARRKKENGATT